MIDLLVDAANFVEAVEDGFARFLHAGRQLGPQVLITQMGLRLLGLANALASWATRQ